MQLQQLDLCFPGRSIGSRFEQFHLEHPEVYAYLVSLAREMRAAGWQSYGIRSLWERARWHFHVERRQDDYKLNDQYTSRMARLIMDENEDLRGFFNVRELRAE